MTTRLGRRLAASSLLAAAAIGGALLQAPPGNAAPARDMASAASGTQRVIVRAQPGHLSDVAAAVRRGGGEVRSSQHALDTLVAEVAPSTVRSLRTAPGVVSVVRDSRVHLKGTTAIAGGLPGNLTTLSRLAGAQAFWKAGFTGQGVDVAVLDSGVAPVAGIGSTDKLLYGPDLSFESQSPNLTNVDTFGHGTHMAGIIAGLDSAPLADLLNVDKFNGVAPGARIVSLKLADSQGRTDVSQVIAAMDWVVQHHADSGLNIRVMNLSFGSDSRQGYQTDPLSFAADVAWRNGIVVVTAAGNDGDTSSGLTDPAYNPRLLAVGAVDMKGTLATDDDTVPTWSSKGPGGTGSRNPDLVAPGRSVVSLRVPGSYTDQTFSSTGLVDTRFFRGSGTSQAAAFTSGAAALLLSQRPSLTPDQVKSLLVGTAIPVRNTASTSAGAGELALGKVLSAPTPAVAAVVKVARGGGSLEGARGSRHIKIDGNSLQGEKDIFGKGLDTTALATNQDRTASWTEVTASGTDWNGTDWTGRAWSGRAWSGRAWSASAWSGRAWSGRAWSSATWESAGWTDTDWTAISGGVSSDTAKDPWAGASWS